MLPIDDSCLTACWMTELADWILPKTFWGHSPKIGNVWTIL
jgi:hypothetical protein